MRNKNEIEEIENTEEMHSNLIRNYKFGVWRSTQEAEEVPLLRV